MTKYIVLLISMFAFACDKQTVQSKAQQPSNHIGFPGDDQGDNPRSGRR